MEGYWERFRAQRVARRRFLTAGAGIGLSAIAMSALGCGGDDDSGDDGASTEESPGTTPGGTAQTGGIFGQTYGSSDTLNILVNPSEYAGMGGQFVYDHLISTRTNDKSPFVLEAASGLEQTDPVTLTFKMRPGMKYHNIAPVNGREVVSEDVKKMQEYVTSLKGIENTFQVNYLDRVDIPDKYTVIYKLKEPRAYLFDSRVLGHPGPQAIIPHETFANLNSARQVGSGPFILDTWTINSKYHYIRNPEYHGRGTKGLPYRDATDVLIIQDQAAYEAAFRSEQIHYYQPVPGQFDNLLSSIGNLARKVEFKGLNPFTWVLNVRKAPFNDIRFREALYRGTNRKQFIYLIYSGQAAAPTGILSAAMTSYALQESDTAQYFKMDIAEGKRLISATGWDTNKEIKIMFSGTGVNQQGAEILKQQWAQIGVKLTADQTQGISEMSPRTLQGNYDMFIGGHPGYDTPAVPMRHNHTQPFHQFAVSGLTDPTLDAMIEKAEKTPAFAENVKLVKEAQLYAIKNYTAYYNIASPINRFLLNTKVQDFEIEASNVAMHRSEMWIKKS
jgi:peptide/nickel transport system substrate-binding protein